MSIKKQYAVKLTAVEWGKVCKAVMMFDGPDGWKAVELHRKISGQLPYLSDEVLESFNQ